MEAARIDDCNANIPAPGAGAGAGVGAAAGVAPKMFAVAPVAGDGVPNIDEKSILKKWRCFGLMAD